VTILRIEHAVPDYEAWKKAFDSDPVSRKEGGVRSHQVLRTIADPNYVMIDLEFDAPEPAEAFLSELRALWSRVEGTIMTSPQARIVEVAESESY
jgi:hypothetical protein